MPGIPDYAVKIWFSLIATGLLENAQTYGAVQYFGSKMCHSKIDPLQEYEC